MGKRKTAEKASAIAPVAAGNLNYKQILADMKQLISDSRHRAAATVNRELVCLYWQIGRVIVQQQETARWGDSVVEQLAADLRLAFPDMKGLMTANLWRMRQFFLAYREIDRWLTANQSRVSSAWEELATVRREIMEPVTSRPNVATVWRDLTSSQLPQLIAAISWSHHRLIFGAIERIEERYFYLAMSVRERWSERELRRQIDAALFVRYMSAKKNPEACLPEVAEQGDLQPFKDHYVLEFLGLAEEHSEKELRKAILGNLRDFFLEFGKDLTFVGEEYPLTIGGETFYIDLLFYHRRLQCLVAIDLKKGKFKPMYVGQSQFYVAALDEQVRLPHENPSIALILCRDANHVQVKLALSVAAKKIGIATYQTALPDERHIAQHMQQLPQFDDELDDNDP